MERYSSARNEDQDRMEEALGADSPQEFVKPTGNEPFGPWAQEARTFIGQATTGRGPWGGNPIWNWLTAEHFDRLRTCLNARYPEWRIREWFREAVENFAEGPCKLKWEEMLRNLSDLPRQPASDTLSVRELAHGTFPEGYTGEGFEPPSPDPAVTAAGRAVSKANAEIANAMAEGLITLAETSSVGLPEWKGRIMKTENVQRAANLITARNVFGYMLDYPKNSNDVVLTLLPELSRKMHHDDLSTIRELFKKALREVIIPELTAILARLGVEE